ncbi:MerR family transcriptional regulator [Streptomyces sp. NPDC127049]|uniref:MerR family transcriptional regulator n=1 Tax=Streptomyces sp. NPDC127049 TaxID=3347118 RepID=UPI00364A28BD
MNGDTLYPIGELARRTGLTVKTVRFYSDRGVVAPTDRSPAGHRLYSIDAVARLDLVRTLRELGLDLPTIRKILDRELSLPEVAAAHAEALTVQIRVLRLRRGVLTAVAERGSTPEETEFMHRLARLSEDERSRLTGEFLDAVFGGLDASPAFAGVMRSMTPELPCSPTTEQVRAWVELAEMFMDQGFRDAVRRMAEDQAAEQAAEQNRSGVAVPRRDVTAAVRDQAGPALAAGIDPTSPQADPIVARFTASYAQLLGLPDDVGLRLRLATRLESVNDPRRERYLQLLAVVNGWPAPESLVPVLDWSVQALRARAPR